MAIYLSPGVFVREIDVSATPTGAGPLRPAFIGTAKRGPLNVPTYITSATQAIETFGEPFPESYLMYAVLAYLEEGNQAYIIRVGVEYRDGIDSGLEDVMIDTTGAKAYGWGRLPVFTGIDYGRISLREVTSDNPATFHAASTYGATYNDADLSTTEGATSAALSFTGTYTGDIDDSYVLVITGAPDISSGSAVGGAEFEIVRNSDGEAIVTGTFTEPGAAGVSDWVVVEEGVSLKVTVSAGVLDVNDTFTFNVRPDNRAFSVSVEGGTATEYTMPSASYTTVSALVTAINALLSSEDYLAISTTDSDDNTIPQLRTDVAGERIQLMGSNAWAIELGQRQYAWDIPRSYLIGTSAEPYSITTQNNRVVINAIGETSTKRIEFNAPIGTAQTADNVSATIDLAGTDAGTTYFESFVLTIPGGTEHVVIVTVLNSELSTLHMLANYSNLKTLRFANEVGIGSPYKRAYRGFDDSRLVLPAVGSDDPSVPLSCEEDDASADCASDQAYFDKIVGWFVATTPGTWIDSYTVSLENYVEGLGDTSGRYKVVIRDTSSIVADNIVDVSFDPREDRYIANIINPGTKYGGTNGNTFINWEERPSFLANDQSASDFEARQPSQFGVKAMEGGANGIPTDPAFSSELDAAIIGDPATGTGIYAFANPETYDINLLLTPGYSSGSVIGTGLQMCEARGDVLYIIDSPFGLRPQQVVDWHNGLLTSSVNSAINSSYGALYWSWLQVLDNFNSLTMWVPPSGHAAAVFARTSRVNEQWSAPAGERRARLLTVRDVEYSPSTGERDLLYGSGNAVNPIVKFPRGIMIYGQRTLQRSGSVLDRIGPRMLMSFLKKNIKNILNNFVFEPNDRITWAQAKAVIEPFLADVQGRRGLRAFRVIIDETNNTPARIANNEMWVSIFVMPENTAEFIVLNLVALRNDASLSAEEILATGGVVIPANSQSQ